MQVSLPSSLSRIKVTKLDLLISSSLIAIITLAVAIRLLPIQWGVYLDEFDPYIQYKGAKYIVENGFSSWFSWFDPTRWAPWGTDVPSGAQLGVPFTGAAFYLLLNYLGINITLYDALVFFPVFSAAILTLLVFLLGKELVGRGVGLLAAFIFAIDPTSIQRTSLGFFDTEATGLLGMFISLLFFMKALKGRTIPYSIISGLALAYMALCWGAYLYPLNLFALYAIVMVLTGRWSRQLSLATTIVCSITMLAMALAPNIGVEAAISPFTAVPMTAFITCLVMSATSFIQDKDLRRKASIGAVFGILVVAVAVTLSGLLGPISGKFLFFVNPLSRVGAPIVGTVGEQFPTIWSSFFDHYHILLLLAPAGIYFALRHMKYKDLFIVLFALMAVYGAGSYVRLMIVVAPALALLTGVALSNLFTNVSLTKRLEVDKKTRARQLSRIYGVLVIVVIVGGMTPLVYSNLRSANRPAMIVSSSTGYAAEIDDWLDALNWMRENIPYNSIVGCWWDYGYWINVIANKSVIADNSTTNGTQIKLIAEAFLNNETHALDIFKEMRVEYVVVYEPWIIASRDPLLGLPPWTVIGDFEKSTAMMAIAGYNTSDYIKGVPLSTGTSTISYPLPAGPKASTTLLYQLLFYPFLDGYSSLLQINITSPQHFELVYSSNNLWVLIYKINYPAT
ncbi:MAG: STT3 domain-containing protein [Candidatus Methanomethylicaceae archaeon]